jgi:hypothetical protein
MALLFMAFSFFRPHPALPGGDGQWELRVNLVLFGLCIGILARSGVRNKFLFPLPG